MQTANRDIFTTEATGARFKAIAPLITTPALDEEFLRRDRIANRTKKRYHFLGKMAIMLIAASAIFTIAEALILPPTLSSIVFNFVAASMVGVGICLQLYLIGTKQKQKWLLNRFATERIRSIKFQAFVNALTAKDASELKSLNDSFINDKLSKLENELNAGIAVLRKFVPSQVLAAHPTPKRAVNKDLADAAKAAFLELRVDYQRKFAMSEVDNFTGRRRLFNSTQDMIYLGAAVFAFMSLGSKILAQLGIVLATDWIDFVAITLFVLGATEAIMDNATLEEQSQSRFEQYIRDIDEVTGDKNPGGKDFGLLIKDMERICLDELDLFSRAADRISYRF